MANNHEISLQQAIDLAARYRDNRPDNFPLCETFEIEAVTTLVSAEGCKFLRIYFGMKENMDVVTILVAANEDGEDILPDINTAVTGDPVILEDGIRCPPLCPPPSSLNGS